MLSYKQNTEISFSIIIQRVYGTPVPRCYAFYIITTLLFYHKSTQFLTRSDDMYFSSRYVVWQMLIWDII